MFRCSQWANFITVIVLFASIKFAKLGSTIKLPEDDVLDSKTECIPASGWADCSVVSGTEQVNVTVLLPYDFRYRTSLQRVGPAIYLGFKKAKEMNLLSDYQIQLKYRNSDCSSTRASLTFMDEVFNDRTHVFFGPSCELALVPVARLLKYFNTPLLTAGGLSFDYPEPTWDPYSEHFLTTRTGFGFYQMAEFLGMYFEKLNWTRAMLMYEKDAMREVSGYNTCNFFMNSVARVFKLRKIRFETFDFNVNNLNASMKETGGQIVVLCASPRKISEILLAAEDLKMVSSGDYVIINIGLFTNTTAGYKPWYAAGDTEETNLKAKTAYEALLTLTLHSPPTDEDYFNFDREVKSLALDKFGFTFSRQPVDIFVSSFYDAAILYATALNETLFSGGSLSDGTAITMRMWNRTIKGVAGDVTINLNGYENANYSLFDMDPITGNFIAVAHYLGKENTIITEPGLNIHWPGVRTEPPPDTPERHDNGTDCTTVPTDTIVVLILASALAFLTLTVFVYCWCIKTSRRLQTSAKPNTTVTTSNYMEGRNDLLLT